MPAQFKNSDIEHATEHASVTAGRARTFRGSQRSSRQRQEQNSIAASCNVEPHLGAAIIQEINDPKFQTNLGRKSVDRTGVQDPERQVLKFASSSNEEKTLTAVSPGKLENSRRKMGKLADENARLQIEVKNLQDERDAVNDALENMLSDLITIQNELEEMKGDMAGHETELLVWRQKVETLSTELEDEKYRSTNMESLFMKLEKEATEKKETELLELQQKANSLSEQLEEKVTTPKIDPEVFELQQKVGKLTAELKEKEGQLKDKSNALMERETRWQAKLRDTTERFEAEFREQHNSTHVKIPEQQMRRKEAGARLRELGAKQRFVDQQEGNRRLAESKEAAALSQVEVEKNKAEQYLQELVQLRASHAAMSQAETDNSKTKIDSEALQRLQESHSAELEKLRHVSNFFKNNSERLSRQTREIMATNRSLQESVQAKDREAREQASLVYALQIQIDELRPQFSEQ